MLCSVEDAERRINFELVGKIVSPCKLSSLLYTPACVVCYTAIPFSFHHLTLGVHAHESAYVYVCACAPCSYKGRVHGKCDIVINAHQDAIATYAHVTVPLC